MKKGFTLVELLGVIVIIVIITLMGNIGVSSLKKGINEKMWESTKKLILEGARRYGEDKKSEIMSANDNCTNNKANCKIVSVDGLLNLNYISTKDYYKESEDSQPIKVIVNKTIEKKDTIDDNLKSGYYANKMEIEIWIENNIVYADFK